jgi:hypothetical protein
VNKQMLDAILSSIIILFQDEFTEHGLYVNFGNDNKFMISIISPNAAKDNSSKSNGMTAFDAKITFIKNIVDKIFDLCQITLQVINKDSNLVIGFSFEEQ